MKDKKPFIFPFLLDSSGRWHDKRGRFISKKVIAMWLARSEKYVEPIAKENVYRTTFVARFPLKGRWKKVRFQKFDTKPIDFEVAKFQFLRKLADACESLAYGSEMLEGVSHSQQYIDVGVEDSRYIGDFFVDEIPSDLFDEEEGEET